MKKLDLRQELAAKYGEEFDASKNWLSRLLNSRKDMEMEELTLLLFYFRSKVCADYNITNIMRSRQDIALLTIANICLRGEVLIRKMDGTHQIIGAQNYADESGRYYTPSQIIPKCLYLAAAKQEDCDLLFGRSCRAEKLVRDFIIRQQEPTVVLMVESGKPDYYMISSNLLQGE